jgi:hyperosmotically inducible protein
MSLARTTLLVSLVATAAFAARPPDGLITSRAKLSLWTTPGVRSSAVHVDTNDGVLTLYGKVPTTSMRTLAQKTAAGIDGVVRVQNLLQVVPVMQEDHTRVTDRDTRALADQALSQSDELKDSSITVKSVDRGVVMLTGEAKTYAAHLRAISLVDRVAGVQRIVSEVKLPRDFREDERVVFLPAPATVDRLGGASGAWDGRINMEVKLRLLTANEVPSNEIRVDTEDGVVTLFGIVPTAAIKNEAGDQASRVAGVIRVDNELEVVATSAKKAVDAKDTDISKDLALAFKGHTEFKGVTTSVKNGAVQLSGKVPNGWERLHALRVTRAVHGVRVVDDQLITDEKRGN